MGHRPEHLRSARHFPWYLVWFNLLGQALERAREVLRRKTIPSLCNSMLLDTAVPMDQSSDTIFEVGPVTHIRLDTVLNPAYAHTATLSAFTDLVPDDYAPQVFLAHIKRVDEHLMPKQGTDLTSGVVNMDDTTFNTLITLASRVSTTYQLPHPTYWLRYHLNHSSTKQLWIKWSPLAPPPNPTSDQQRPDRGAALA